MLPNDSEIKQPQLPFNNLYLNSGFVTGLNNWRFYVLTILITTFIYLLAPAITSLHLIFLAQSKGLSIEEIAGDMNMLFDPKVSGIDKNLILLALFGIFVLASLAFFIALKKIHRKTLTSVLTGYDNFRFKRFWFAFGIWSGLVVIATLFEYSLNPQEFTFSFDLGGFLIGLLLLVIFMPIQSGFEEVFFRGYLMQGLSLITKNGIVPLIITSLLFGAAHMSNPEAKEYGWALMLTYYVFFALFMGAITLIDEGLELAIGIHTANNIMASILVSSDHSVIKTYSILEEKTTAVGADIAIWFACALIAGFIFKFKYHWTNFNLLIK